MERLDKILAGTGRWSRREVKELVCQGRVRVDGQTARTAEEKVDPEAAAITVDGQPVDLSNKEFELLIYFMENQGMALSREKILNNVWNYDYFGDARTIDTHVKKLRSKLGEKGEFIKTIWGMGYKFEVNA